MPPYANGAVPKSAYTNGVTEGSSVHAFSSPLFRVGGLSGRDYLKLAVCAASGAVFGIAAEKARGILHIHNHFLSGITNEALTEVQVHNNQPVKIYNVSPSNLPRAQYYAVQHVCTHAITNASQLQFTVHIPSVIQQQMLFTQNVMLKAFLAAVSSCESRHQTYHHMHTAIACNLLLQPLQHSLLSTFSPSQNHFSIRYNTCIYVCTLYTYNMHLRIRRSCNTFQNIRASLSRSLHFSLSLVMGISLHASHS